MSGSLWLAFAMVLTASLTVAFGLWLDSWFGRRQRPRRATLFQDATAGAVFLFDGDVLVDCSPAGRAILASNPAQSGPWARLLAYLGPRFSGLEDKLARLTESGPLTLASEGDRPLLLTAELRGGLTRLTLVDAETEDRIPSQDPMTLRAQAEELEQLRSVVVEAPVLIWRERADGAVIWANAAYLARLTERLEPGTDIAWPLPALFDAPATAPAKGKPDRRMLKLSNGGEAWYELQARDMGGDRVIYALPADQMEQAERALREVLITLTKTFAHLRVGLAIFDRQRKLQLFNPAMTDLTGLPVDFLARKPSFTAVLDAMRERNTIPEPKDYRSWRKQLIQMERAAASGLYEETWSLPSGQTYRIIGRPHPDGALALILEDISDEMTRSRRYRAEIELGLSVIDGLDEAVAVFAQSGELVMSNTAYAQLWGQDPAANLAEASLATMLAHWKARTAPNPIWAAFEDLAAASIDRRAFGAEARLTDGRLIACRFTPLVGGATMAAFRLVPQDGPRAVRVPARKRA
jgi:PAS domain-containing protein